MIRINSDTPVTVSLVVEWIRLFKSDTLPNVVENRQFYLNERKNVVPYAKKIVTISTAATLGDGIDVKLPEENAGQQETLDRIFDLWKRQTIEEEDLAIVSDGCTYGFAYELGFMSSDEVPKPKVKALSPECTFVVFDDTVEDNGLYGVYFIEHNGKSEQYTDVTVYDEVYQTEIRLPYIIKPERRKCVCLEPVGRWRRDEYYCREIGWAEPEHDSVDGVVGEPYLNREAVKSAPREHNMGRMPVTMYFNNRELQGDFEQVKPTIVARNNVEELAMDDAETIAGNYLTFYGAKLAGNTDEEKKRTIQKIGHTKVLELEDGERVEILTKTEAFNMISVFGKDLENKVYDLSMVCNFTSEEFAGNVTGVALRLKLFPFKRLVKNKDSYIKKLYRRRLKMYQYALMMQEGMEEIDIGGLEISIHRTWEENILELAQTIAQLYATGIFSDKYLIEKMPDGEYEVEVRQKSREADEKAKESAANADPANASIGQYNALLRSLTGGAQDAEREL